MRATSVTARLLLGLLFTVFGLNGFFHFLPMPPPPATGMQFLGTLASTNYLVPIFALQLVSGLLLLSNRYVPLALTLIAPVIVNILMYHTLMDLKGIVPGALATLCWLVTFYSVRPAFAGLFQAKVEQSADRRSAGVMRTGNV